MNTNESKIRIVIPDQSSQFSQHECKIIDVSHSENTVVVECDRVDTLSKLGILLLKGHGIGIHPTYQDYRPFNIEDDGIYWWHDPRSIPVNDFYSAINALYKEIFG